MIQTERVSADVPPAQAPFHRLAIRTTERRVEARQLGYSRSLQGNFIQPSAQWQVLQRVQSDRGGPREGGRREPVESIVQGTREQRTGTGRARGARAAR